MQFSLDAFDARRREIKRTGVHATHREISMLNPEIYSTSFFVSCTHL